MTPNYLLAALSLALSDPLALLAETLVMLARLHLIVPACYLIFRALGFQWDGIGAGASVLRWVHEVRTTLLPLHLDVPVPTPNHSKLTDRDYA